MEKKKYVAPNVELVLFETNERIMDEVRTSDGDDWGDWGVNSAGRVYLPNGTVINNNGAPTFVPGGNGGGGRQTPLG